MARLFDVFDKEELMGFFGLFKSKQEREMDAAMRVVGERVFPGGEKDIIRDCERVDAITGGKIPPEKLRGFVAGCKTLVHLSESDDEARFVNSFLQRAAGGISEREAYDMYVYFAGEARYYDLIKLQAKRNGADLSVLGDALFGDMPWIYSAGVRTDEIPGGYGEYGLVATNPIPTVSILGSNRYLGMLRFEGHPVEASRFGSTSSEVTPGPVDRYMLTVAGSAVGSVFICPYHKRNSQKAPKGFTLAAG